ncbi:DUF21-domain-containing protein [Mollisia scopiformis]|uniref:DUF21-domain-containing protein n=1 Tax=Mollisia scopiformis TaxID=149040 RepID=A0A194XN14_MOLSC|nr:DUF21-domain-containing protein [Mollisia scopiformis]KUJ21655.1 DUF21-domain-containing protein [Mollisia scopiformis]
MGQDQVQLQVIAQSGTRSDRDNARKVLNVLQRGRHWVLVSLLLGNVITNEALPILLDQDVKGGWFAVLASTILIVVFGEIIPQSLCAKHGLAIGAWSSRYVLWVMYVLYPVAYPIAKLLDRLLGASHGLFFDRDGLKSFVMLHECLNFSTERLNKEEVTVISSMLDLNSRPVSGIMTPFAKLYTLGTNQPLDEMTRYNILNSGYSCIPVHMEHHATTFVGILQVKSLVALNLMEQITIGQLNLESMVVVRPNASCQELIHVFRDRKVKMILVTERGTPHGEPLGIVTSRDLMNELIGDPLSFKEGE